MAVSYFGGKRRMSKWINSFIPKNIETYAEPFSGAYWVYMAGTLYANKVVYNDFNRYMVNLFACASKPKVFLKHLESVKSQNEKLFYQFKDDVFKDGKVNMIKIPDYEYAMKYLYVLTQVFSGTNPERGKFIDLKGKYTSKYDSFINKMKNEKWKRRFQSITDFTNLDFEDVIKQNDGKNSYFYCDPPYYGFEKDGKKAYALNDFCKKDHERLANVLKKIKGKFSLSYYEFDELKEWFPEDKFRWDRKVFKKAAGAKKDGTMSEGTEVLIMNY